MAFESSSDEVQKLVEHRYVISQLCTEVLEQTGDNINSIHTAAKPTKFL